MILIQSPDGKEKVLVSSLNGYENWTVIANPCRAPRSNEFWSFETQSWQVDQGMSDREELLRAVRNPELLADLLADILARLPTVGE